VAKAKQRGYRPILLLLLLLLLLLIIIIIIIIIITIMFFKMEKIILRHISASNASSKSESNEWVVSMEVIIYPSISSDVMEISGATACILITMLWPRAS
jgi:flagellar basal body-associated protein FliL